MILGLSTCLPLKDSILKNPLALLGATLSALALAFGASDALAQQKTPLLIYTALETDALKFFKEGFEKSNPDIDIKWVRDSTGIITAKILAEKANPQADVIAGVAATSMALFAKEGLLLPYEPKGFQALDAQYSDAARPPTWVGMDVWAATVCFNTVEAKKQNLPKPESWKDLTNPVYKGKITMPHPASSGTGYLDVSGWLQMWGEQEGWKYMDALHENIAQYVHSGSKPCRQAGAGEFPIGIAFEYRGHQVKKSGAPIDLIFPKEGLGWDIEANGIMKSTKKLDAAKRFVDWMAGTESQTINSQWWAIVTLPGIAKPLDGIPANFQSLLIKNNFAWASENRERILAEWTKRYDGKSEKK